MMRLTNDLHVRLGPATALAAILLIALVVRAEPDLSDIPGYDRYQLVQRSMSEFARGGTVRAVRWTEDGRLLYTVEGQRSAVDLATMERTELEEGDEPRRGGDRPRRRGPGRGRQFERAASPDGSWTAICRDWNVVIEDGEDQVVHRVTTQGSRKHRYGKASWVYGEELDQNTAMWWSPDSTMLAFYEFDERRVEDFYLVRGLTEVRTEPVMEGYPKPGEPNPVARLHVYHLESGRTVAVDTGSPQGTGHYVYSVRFSPDGRYLLFNRTNRWQNRLEVVAADPATGESRVVLTETQETWQENSPEMRFLADGHRFIWETERTGFKQLELRDLSGGWLATLTDHDAPVDRIILVDEPGGTIFYTAFTDEELPLNAQLHRVGLDGRDGRRLTAPGRHHSVQISPDGRWFVTRAETLTDPPVTTLHDGTDGEQVLVLAESDSSRFQELGLQPAELFTVKAADGETDLYGILYKPSDFRPDRLYPLVVDVYGGPFSQRVRNSYRPVNPLCELGFLVAVVDNRGTINRGKAFESANYLKLGEVDLDDQAAAVRALAERPYVDGGRVGIYGSSYGGYMSALAVLKHPDVFHAAVAGAAFFNDTATTEIYTERYMRTPEANPDGYEQGSCLTYAHQLSGRLLLLHGMMDDNVHPTNAWQLVDKLHELGRSFEMMFFPNNGHGLGALHRQLIGATGFEQSEQAADAGEAAPAASGAVGGTR
jgi:dipeptidyl-peptidase-4